MSESKQTSKQDYRANDEARLRVLFCIGVSQSFFDSPSALVPELVPQIVSAFADLEGRFGVHVLGTIDDDELMVGPSATYPWTAYVLADAPNLDAVTAVCNIVRSTAIGEHKLWRYLKIEARVGRPLFFANA